MKRLIFTGSMLAFTLAGWSQPFNYYNQAEGKKANELKAALHQTISGHIDYSYNTSKYLMNYCDADPANPSNVILIYTQRSQNSDTYGTGGDYINREHVWAKSHGNFADIRPMDSDVHNLHPADASVNVIRSNRDFDMVAPNGTQLGEAPGCWYNDNAWEPSDAAKGQIARTILYMDVRYEGTNGEMNLTAADGVNTYPQPKHGNLKTLLEWNRKFPPTDFERRRNERIYIMQLNRNPFVDHPEFADLIWGTATAPTITISGNSLSPAIPIENGKVSLAVSIQSPQAISSVKLFWSKTFNGQDHSINMQATGNNYSAEMDLSGFSGDNYLYYKVVVTDQANQERVKHFTSFIHKNISKDQLTALSKIQGSGDASEMVNENVTISGRVSKIIDTEYYIQNEGKREAMCVYIAPQTGAIGDSIVLSGTVTEYNNLTEIKNISYFCNLGNNKQVKPIEVKINELNEDLEGKLIEIKNATFSQGGTTISSNGGSFNLSDGTGTIPLYVNYSSKLVGQKLPTGSKTITAILSQYKSTYQLIARDINDINKSSTGAESNIITANSKFDVFPNPASGGKLFTRNNQNTVAQFSICDLLGQVHMKGKVDPGVSGIDIQDFKPGIYFITFLGESERPDSFKIVVQ